MFGISFIELLVILTIAIIIIGPKDIPEVARHVAKFIFKAKRFLQDGKEELSKVTKEMGLDDIRAEIETELVEEGLKSAKEELTSIIDIYGNEHKVQNIDKLRPDLKKEDLEEEVNKYNKINQKAKNESGE